MVTKTSQILPTYEDANFEIGEMYCKHCCSVFKTKYTFKKHLESSQHLFNGFVPARAVLSQYNTWYDLLQKEPLHCPSCFKVFTSRQGKYKHIINCNKPAEEVDRQTFMNMKNKVQDAFDLLIGKLPDRAFSIDYTYQDVRHILDECILCEAILGQNVSVIIKELYLSSAKDSIFDVINYDPTSDTFNVYEYTSWECLPREIAVDLLFDKSLLIINSFKIVNSVDFQNIYNEYPFKVDLKIWIDDLNEYTEKSTGGLGDNMVRRIQKDKIRRLFLA